MGRLLMKLNWDRLVPDKDGGWSCLEFSDAIEKCLDKATTDAVDAVTKEWEYSTNSRFPVAPLIRAGEDFWIVCRRNLAIRLALALGEAYEDLTQRTEIIASSLNAIPELREERLTLSFGILFAKQGFPIEAQLHMVEALVKNAKRFRARYFSANGRPKSGCMDYYWLESSAREDVIEYRDSTLRISESDGADFQLYTTPWALSEAKQFLMAAEQLARSTLASRKLKQLDTILRLGYDLSSLAFAQWKRMLEPGEWQLFIDACKLLPDRFPIHEMLLREEPFLPVPSATNEWWTPLLDLTKMVEIQTTDL